MEKIINTSIPDFTLRFATEEDVPAIFSFIKALAEFEKMSDEVMANEELLRQNLFGDEPYAEVLLAQYDEQAIGFALFFHNFSTFVGKPGLYLEDVFIEPEYRGRGFGTSILRYLAKLALERNCGRFEWSVLNWNDSAIEFYESLGAKPMDGWTVYRLTEESMADFANLSDV